MPELQLVRNAVRAERAGFSFALVSDHFLDFYEREVMPRFS